MKQILQSLKTGATEVADVQRVFSAALVPCTMERD